LKGIVLAYAAYKDPSLRPMMDLDLLVPLGEREHAIGVLRKLEFGYPQGLSVLIRDHIWRLAPGQEFAPLLQSSKSRVQVEIHTMLECSEPLSREPVEEFWSRSTTAALGGLCARTLCPEDNLFHICLHQARAHRFEKGCCRFWISRFSWNPMSTGIGRASQQDRFGRDAQLGCT